MRLLVLIFLFTAQPAAAQLAASVQGGVQREHFRWSIAGNNEGRDPNILSELVWEQLSGPAAGAALSGRFWKRWEIRAGVQHWWIRQGKATDTDYAEDNRQQITYRKQFPANQGHTRSVDAGIKYQLIHHKSFQLAAGIGYSFRLQLLLLRNTAATSSSYQTAWNMAAVDATAAQQLGRLLRVKGGWQVRLGSYHAQADWYGNAAYRHPVSFEQQATAFGGSVSVQLFFRPDQHWQPFAGLLYGLDRTGSGKDVLYLSNGQYLQTRFNGARGEQFQLQAGLSVNW